MRGLPWRCWLAGGVEAGVWLGSREGRVTALPLLDLDVGDLTSRLLGLYGPEVEAVLALDVPEHAGPPLALVEQALPAGQPLPDPSALDALVARLLDVTAPGQALDPQVLGSDVPWAVVVGRLLDDVPAMARQSAVTWVRQLDRHGHHGHVPHAVVAAVAAYSVAAAEEALGRPVQARRWAMEANALVEYEEPPGLSLATYARAAVLLGRGRGQG